MKNLSFIFNVILAIAVAILFFKVFENKDHKATEVENTVKQDTLNNEQIGAAKILYVNTDTIWEDYELVKVLRANLESKQAQYKAQLQQRVKSLEDKYSKLRQDAPTLTQAEGEKRQAVLMQEQDAIQKMQESLSGKLSDEEDNMKKNIRSKLDEFLTKFKQNKKVDLILDYSLTSSVLVADSSLDITDEVLKELNANYEAENKDNKKK